MRIKNNSHNSRKYLKFARKKWLQDIREKLVKRDPHCHYCRKKLFFKNSTVDHIVARANGGLDQEDNLVLSCQPCNKEKGDMSYKKFKASIKASMDAKINNGYENYDNQEYRGYRLNLYKNPRRTDDGCYVRWGKPENVEFEYSQSRKYPAIKLALIEVKDTITSIVDDNEKKKREQSGIKTTTLEINRKSGFRGPQVVRIEEPEEMNGAKVVSEQGLKVDE